MKRKRGAKSLTAAPFFVFPSEGRDSKGTPYPTRRQPQLLLRSHTASDEVTSQGIIFFYLPQRTPNKAIQRGNIGGCPLRLARDPNEFTVNNSKKTVTRAAVSRIFTTFTT